MRTLFLSESDVEKRCGRVQLSPEQKLEAAERLTRNQPGMVARHLATGNRRELRALLRREESALAERLAMQSWLKSHNAVYDPHRQKWMVAL